MRTSSKVRDMAITIAAPRVRVVVTFIGGPCEGIFEVGSGKTDHHIAAALAYEKYKASPPGIGRGFWGGICGGKAHSENYIIVEAKTADGRMELVCNYNG